MTPPIHRSERLLNLLIALRHTQVAMSKQDIRQSVHGYQQANNDAAFERMFERDKKDLRELGFPIESETGTVHEDEHGYRLNDANYALPPLHLSSAQMSVLTLATNLWQDAEAASFNRNALTKLRAVGPSPDAQALAGLQLKQQTPDSALISLIDAAARHQVVQFTYRSAYSGQLQKRKVEPWRVFSQHGGWYLLGLDQDKQEHRTFRISRIVGKVVVQRPQDAFEVPNPLPAAYVQPETIATLLVQPQQAWQLRRRGNVQAGSDTGWEVLRLPYREELQLADEIASFGDRVLVQEPASLQAAVLHRLQVAARFELLPVPEVEIGSTPSKTTSRKPVVRETATERLVRLLALIAYLEESGEQQVEALAAHFGVSRKQIINDIDTLWVSGTPGYQHEDLIDFSMDHYDREIVKLVDSRKMNKPVRLSQSEAISLLAALHALQVQPDVVNTDLVQSTIDALLEIMSSEMGDFSGVLASPSAPPEVDQRTMDLVREAISAGHQLEITYVSALDERTVRVIDPWSIHTNGRSTYVNAWCHHVQQERNFRADRIEAAVLQATAIEKPASYAAAGRDKQLLDTGSAASASQPLRVVLTLEPWGRFLADMYENEIIREHQDGSFTIQLDAFQVRWIESLLLGHAPAIREIYPHELSVSVANRAINALEGYKSRLGLQPKGR